MDNNLLRFFKLLWRIKMESSSYIEFEEIQKNGQIQSSGEI